MKLSEGIRFGDHFAIDPTCRTPLAIVSHAHSDHMRAHDKLIATAPTIDMARLNFKRFEGVPVEYNQQIEIGPAKVELTPAGHMLGSAQVLIDWEGEKIVYTGDFKLDRNLTCHPAQIHKCDVLLIDTTYGKARYKFPSMEECSQKLLEFIVKNLRLSITPVILAYTVGKSQEAMKIIGDAGFEMDIYPKAYDMAQVYIKHGIDIKNIFPLGEKPSLGRVVVLPPGALKQQYTYGWGRYKTCFLSGWTLDKVRSPWGGNGYGIPFSDHASFEDIVRYVEEAKPRQIYTLFGPGDIAEYLRRLGYKAEVADFNSGHSLTPQTGGNLELFS